MLDVHFGLSRRGFLRVGFLGLAGLTLADNLHPSCGSVVARMRGSNAPRLPAYVCLPSPPPSANAAYLGVAYNPFAPGSDPSSPDFKVRDLRPAPRVDADRFNNRRDLLQGL